MNFGYIYKTTSLIDGRVYVGQKRGDFKSKYQGSGKHLRLAITNEARIKMIGNKNATKKEPLYV